MPFAEGNTNSVPISSVFDTPPVFRGVRRYTIQRLNVAGQTNNIDSSTGSDGTDFVDVADDARLERGIGYRIIVEDKEVLLKTKNNA